MEAGGVTPPVAPTNPRAMQAMPAFTKPLVCKRSAAHAENKHPKKPKTKREKPEVKAAAAFKKEHAEVDGKDAWGKNDDAAVKEEPAKDEEEDAEDEEADADLEPEGTKAEQDVPEAELDDDSPTIEAVMSKRYKPGKKYPMVYGFCKKRRIAWRKDGGDPVELALGYVMSPQGWVVARYGDGDVQDLKRITSIDYIAGPRSGGRIRVAVILARGMKTQRS